MTDPFEFPQQPVGASQSTSRESFIQQAVTFLNDPRVKNADPDAALDFLRKKGITETELREAYRRCGLPFLSPHANPFPPSNAPVIPPYLHPPTHLTPFQPPQPRGPSWLSLFLGITAAAGIYAALREVLKRYVVPLYFPEAARVAEDRRRRDQSSWQAQEVQIAELRERVQELVESSRKTNERMERLTTSITSSMALREREVSQSSELRSELRDAIRQLSYSVSASGGTETSRVMREEGVETVGEGGYLQFLNGAAQKRGSLAYSHGDQFNGGVRKGWGEGVEAVEDVSSMNVREERVKRGGDDDEFMAIKPAEVEVSWGLGILNTGEVGEEGGETEEGKKGAEGEIDGGVGEKVKAGEVMDEVEVVVAGEEDATKEVELNGGVTEAARQLFEMELLHEAKQAFGKASDMVGGACYVEEKRARGRPSSMPTMDPPLSDDD